MKKTTVDKTLDELRLIFAQHDLPEQLMSDNGPQFIAHEFKEFMIQNVIKHIRVAPYHPASNGAAERAVRLFKESFTKQVLESNSERSLKHRIADFLLRYISTPHGTAGLNPAELLMKRQLRIKLSLVKPDLTKLVNKSKNFRKFCLIILERMRTFFMLVMW